MAFRWGGRLVVPMTIGVILILASHVARSNGIGLSHLRRIASTNKLRQYDWPAPRPRMEDFQPLISEDQILSFHLKDAEERPAGVKIHVVRAILQSDASTWKGTKPALSTHFIQVLAYIITPPRGHRVQRWDYELEVTCGFVKLAGAATAEGHEEEEGVAPLVNGVKGEVDWVQGGPRDGRSPDGTSFFYTACPIPSSSPPQLSQLNLSLAFKLVRVFQDGPSTIIGEADSQTITLSLSTSLSQPKVLTTACISPVWYEMGLQPTRRFLEWRTHMARLGVERVAWYTREDHFYPFVETYNLATGAKDTVTVGRGLKPESEYDLPWLDQDLWYADCLLKNRFTTDYLLIIDADEFIRFGDEEEEDGDEKGGSLRITKLFEEQKAMVGALTLDRSRYLPGDKERVAWPGGTNPADLLAQEALRCRDPDGKGLFKTIYRASTVYRLNQHAPNVMYPASSSDQQSDGLTVVPKRAYEIIRKAEGGQGWPELGHFRYQYWPAKKELCPNEGGEAPFLTSEKRKYLSRLRREVDTLEREVDKANRAWLDALYEKTILR